MATSGNQSGPTTRSPASPVAIAWVVTVVVLSLPDILWYELAGVVPSWLFWARVGLLGALVLLSWLWDPIRALHPFFVALLAMISLMKANTWLQASSAWLAWQKGQSFALAATAVQSLEMVVALFLIGVLFLLRKRRQRFFLVRGDLKAKTEPVKWLGQKSPRPLPSFGWIFTLVVVAAQVFMFILPLSPTSDTLRRLLPLIPVILLLAAANGVTEEIIFRAAPISTVYEVVGKTHAIWMAAVLFGLSHYIGGIPSGIPGVLITSFLGWFFGKCMVDSKGFFWPWLFHAVQDILPFTLMALAAIS